MHKRLSKSFIIIVSLSLVVFLLMGCGQQKVSKPAKQDQQPDPVTTKTTYTLFFPYDTGTDVAIKEVTVTTELKADESKLDKLADLLRHPDGQGNPVFGPDVKFLDVTMLDNEVIRVNVNREFITQMTAGAGLETQIIQSLVNTTCKLYDAKGVLLRVEGQPFESGHNAYRENEVIYAQ